MSVSELSTEMIADIKWFDDSIEAYAQGKVDDALDWGVEAGVRMSW